MSLFERVVMTEGRPGYQKIKGGEVYPPQPHRNNPWSFRINAMRGSIVNFEEKNGKWVVLIFRHYKPDHWPKRGVKIKTSYPTKEALIAAAIKASKQVDKLEDIARAKLGKEQKIKRGRDAEAARAR
jgi:hypothetical protein